MSKDKYRPSLTDKEVVTTSVEELPPLGPSGDLAETGELEDNITGPSKVAPAGLKVVSQKAYYSPEGHQYVEVVFEWDSVPGATEYLLRVAT